jgi:predicted Zn-dependent protease
MRVLAFAVGVLGLLGCTLPDVQPEADGGRPMAANQPPNPPCVQWDLSDSSVPSVPSATETEPDTLTLAAECLERGDRASAAMHLESYVCRHPDQLMFRAQLAEMLLRLGRDAMARAHYERFAADAQSAAGPVRHQLISAHTRLMEIAQRADDRFGELFHRGVGLLLLAREQERLPPREADPAFAEEMTCKALSSLREAKELKPSDARTRAYLAEAHERCGNHRAAETERAAARRTLVPGQLTAAEREMCLLGGQTVR